MGCGAGTNTRAKLLVLWGLLRFASNIGIVSIQVFGDSKVIVDWATGCLEIQVITLVHWCQRTKSLISSFSEITFQHIFRELNSVADGLSKKAVGLQAGLLHFEELKDNIICSRGSLKLF